MKLKKILAAVSAAAVVCSLTACSENNTSSVSQPSVASSDTTDSSADAAESSAAESTVADQADTASTTSTDKNFKIGIAKLMDHPALNKSESGFVDALKDKGYVDGENIEIDYQNGQGETSNLNTIATQFVGNSVDLIFAIATPAAQSCAGQTTEIPIIGTAITDFAEAGLVNSNDNPGTNVSGTTDMNPFKEQIDLMLELFPDTKTVGFVYTASEDNSVLQVTKIKEYLDEKGVGYTEKTIINTNDIQQAVQSIVGECDAIYIPTDNNMASAMPLVASIANPAQKPVICGEIGMVESGGFGTLSIDYYNLGYQAGEMAVKVLEGGDISTMAIESQTEFQYGFNKDAVDAIGIELPEKYKEYVVETAAEGQDDAA